MRQVSARKWSHGSLGLSGTGFNQGNPTIITLLVSSSFLSVWFRGFVWMCRTGGFLLARSLATTIYHCSIHRLSYILCTPRSAQCSLVCSYAYAYGDPRFSGGGIYVLPPRLGALHGPCPLVLLICLVSVHLLDTPQSAHDSDNLRLHISASPRKLRQRSLSHWRLGAALDVGGFVCGHTLSHVTSTQPP